MRVFLVLMVAFTSLVVTAAALGQPPTGQVYGGAAGVEEQVGTAGEVTGSTLPFTGLDIAFAVAAGVGLLAVGLAARRFARAR